MPPRRRLGSALKSGILKNAASVLEDQSVVTRGLMSPQ